MKIIKASRRDKEYDEFTKFHGHMVCYLEDVLV